MCPVSGWELFDGQLRLQKGQACDITCLLTTGGDGAAFLERQSWTTLSKQANTQYHYNPS